MEDRAPQLAVCLPGEALPWAREGLLLPLTGAVRGQSRIQEQVLACCVHEERLFMLPLLARHRRMAVNRALLEEKQMGYLISGVEHPVWYVTQLHQVMEEFMLSGTPAFEIWPAGAQTSAGIEALAQALYGGALLAQDGETCLAAQPPIRAAVKWLREMTNSGMIGRAADREAALARFVGGQTPVFIDWTQDMEAAHAGQLSAAGVELTTMPYPSSTGEMVRSFELTGVCAFAGEEAANDLAVRAVAFLHEDERAQAILGDRAIGRDDARWLPSLSADGRGATLRALFASAVDAVVGEGADADTALEMLQAAMDALPAR